jgi:hypothetical protein
MTDPLYWLKAVGALTSGLILGFAHFVTLASVSADYLAGHALRAVIAQGLRIGIMAAALFCLARLGALPLLAGALGIVTMRAIVLRERGEP